jgi:hypothetical protein
MKNQIAHTVWREKEAIKSVRKISDSSKLNDIIEQYVGDIEESSQLEMKRINETIASLEKTGMSIEMSPLKDKALEHTKKMIPTRLFKAPLSMEYMKKTLSEKQYEWIEELMEKDKTFGKKSYEVINFMNGERSILEIANAVSAEYDKTDVNDVLQFVKFLEKAELVSMKS